MATLVPAPNRKPRAGGIKSVVDEYIEESRLAGPGFGEVSWIDAGCGLPRPTRAGCYDTGYSPIFPPIVVEDGGVTLTFSREDDTVSVSIVVAEGADPEGFSAPWLPISTVTEDIGDGTVSITALGAGTFPTAPTEAVETPVVITYGTEDPDDPEKTATGLTEHSIIAPPFAQYAGVECWIGGDTDGLTYEEQARDLLEGGEDRAVEAALWDWAVAAPESTAESSIVDAIGVAEDWADAHYVGLPVIMMSRSLANAAGSDGALKLKDGVLLTTNGTPVIATSAVGEDEGLVVIGMPGVYASGIKAVTAIEHRENVAMAIAERVYAVGVDCDFRYRVARFN